MKKTAQQHTIPSFYEGTQPSNAAPATKPAAGGQHYSATGVASEPVRLMQQELISIVSEIVKSSGTPLIGDKFINFMAQRTGKFQSVTTTTDSAVPAEKVTAIVNTMRNIGHEGGGSPDGIWGPRTNTGLLNVAALAEALLELAKQNDNKVIYDDKKLAEFRSLIPAKDTDYSDRQKDGYALRITQDLRDIHTLYNQVAEQNLNKSDAVKQTQAPEQTGLTDAQLVALFKAYPNFVYTPAGSSVRLSIGIKDLVNRDAFNTWCQIKESDVPNLDPQDVLRTLLTVVQVKE